VLSVLDAVRDGSLIVKRQRDTRSALEDLSFAGDDGDPGVGAEGVMSARRRSRARIGARERKERRASLNIIHGEVRREERDLGVGEGCEATVCRISPI